MMKSRKGIAHREIKVTRFRKASGGITLAIKAKAPRRYRTYAAMINPAKIEKPGNDCRSLLLRAPKPAPTFKANLAAITPPIVAIAEAKIVVPIISAGLADCILARTAMIVMGTRVILPVLSAKNIIIELEAVSFCALSDCNSSIALMPRGVAALLKPSQLADRLRTIAPMAG